jgi:predicted DNA binding CopG/RHH family protein
MIKKCEICKSELFQDENGEWFCPDCVADEFMEKFNPNDDSDIENAKWEVVKPKTKPVTIRLNEVDIQRAKKLAKEKKVPYQSLLKEIIHKNLA